MPRCTSTSASRWPGSSWASWSGLTGMGGGALDDPDPRARASASSPSPRCRATSSPAVVMKPIGGGIHFRRGTVHTGLVKWLAIGSVPGALFGVVLRLAPERRRRRRPLKLVLGVVLLVAAAAMVGAGTSVADRGDGARRRRTPVPCGPRRDVLIGLVGGLVVGMTSVGSGSLMIVAADAALPDAVVEGARRHRSRAGDPARAGGCDRPSRLGASFELGAHRLVAHRRRPRRVHRRRTCRRVHPTPSSGPCSCSCSRVSALKLLDVPERGAGARSSLHARIAAALDDVARHAAAAAAPAARASRSAGGVGVTRFSTRLSANTAVRTGSATGGNHGMRYMRRV